MAATVQVAKAVQTAVLHLLPKRTSHLVHLAVALVALGACSNRSEHQLEITFQAARNALWCGRYAEAQAFVERGLALTRSHPESEWSWRFRLLEGDVLVASNQITQVLPLLKVSLPDGPEFDVLRARQKYLEAKTQLEQGSLREVLTTLERA